MYWDLDLAMQGIICYQFQIIWDDLVVDIIQLQFYTLRKIGELNYGRTDPDCPLSPVLGSYSNILGG